ncbi:MAG TPA: recombinase zinc beta ribbon domain-containing protein [Planctomycetota bacterium]
MTHTPHLSTAACGSESVSWTVPPRTSPVFRQKYPLTGLLFCSECGGPLTISVVVHHRNHSIRYIYYGCQGGRDSGNPKPCYCKNLVKLDILLDTMLDHLFQRVLNDGWVDTVMAETREEFKRQRSTQDKRLPNDRKRLAKLETDIASAERRLARIPESALENYLAELDEMKRERAELLVAVSSAGEQETLVDVEKRLRQRVQQITSVLREKDAESLRSVLLDVIERVEISPKREVVLTAKVPVVSSVGTPWGVRTPGTTAIRYVLPPKRTA